MTIVPRLASYFAACVMSSAVFTVWMACIEFGGPIGQQLGALNVASEALRHWPYILLMALLVMFLPWCVMMWISRRWRLWGPVYCASSTAVAALFAFGTFGGLLPARGHPTFLEGFTLAVETSGLPVLVSGAIGGLIYWLVRQGDERLKQMRSVAPNGADVEAH